jgi:hypothetical protein
LEPSELAEPTVQALANFAGINFPPGSLSPSTKEPIVREAISWLCDNDFKVEELSEPTLLAISNIAKMPALQISASTRRDPGHPRKSLMMQWNGYKIAVLYHLILMTLIVKR